MNEQLPSEESAEHPFGDLSDFGATKTQSRLTRNSWIGIAAGAVLLAGGAGGFLWVSSSPGADSALAAASTGAGAGAVSTPDETTSPSTGSVNFTGSGRDLFAGSGGSASGTSAAGDATNGGAASSTSADTASGGEAAEASDGTAWLEYLASLTTSSRATAPAGSTATTPSASAPSTGVASPTPSATASATGLPSWTVPVVSYVTGDATSGTFKVGGEKVTVAKGDLIFPLQVRYNGVTSNGSAILTVADNANTGWLVPYVAGEPVALPTPALGGTTDRVRVYGNLDEDNYWISIDRRPGLTYKVNETVVDTPYTYLGPSFADAGYDYVGVWFKDSSNILYFGSFGAGEADGVSF